MQVYKNFKFIVFKVKSVFEVSSHFGVVNMIFVAKISAANKYVFLKSKKIIAHSQ